MTDPGSTKEKRAAVENPGSLMTKCRLWEIATFAFVILLSPASLVFGLAYGIAPDAWLTAYLRYVAVFIPLAVLVALAGFEVAASYWLRAERAKNQGVEGKP